MSIKTGNAHFTHRSFFMLIRVHTGSVRLVVPLSVFVLDQTLAAIQELVWVAERLVPGLRQRLSDKMRMNGRFPSQSAPSEAIGLCREIIHEMRRYGRWRMVEVETADKIGRDIRIYVDFF